MHSCAEIERTKWRASLGNVLPKHLNFTAMFLLALTWSVLSQANAAGPQIIGNQIKMLSCPEAHVGKLYVNSQMVISTRKNDTLQVTVAEVGKSGLPNWLIVTPDTHELKGIPLADETREYKMVITVINKELQLSTQCFTIMVFPPPSTQCQPCTYGPLVTMATVTIAVDYKGLNATERIRVFTQVSKVFEVSTENITARVTNDILANGALHVCNKTLIEKGPGLGSNISSTKFLAVSWIVDPKALHSSSICISEKARNGSVGDSIGFPVVGWHLMSGNTVLNCSNSTQVLSLTTALLASVKPSSEIKTLQSSTMLYYSTSSYVASRAHTIVGSTLVISTEMATALIRPSSTMTTSSSSSVCIGDTAPRASTSFGPLNVDIGKVQQIVVPSTTFSDNEDGNTRQLTLSLHHLNGDKLPQDHWVELILTQQALFIVPTKTELLQQPKIGYEILLRAQDKCGNKADLRFTLTITGQPQVVCFKTYMTVKSNLHTIPTVLVKQLLLQRLQNHLGRGEELYFFSFKKEQNDDVFTLIFSGRSIICFECIASRIEVFSKLFIYANGSVNYDLIMALSGLPRFTLVSVNISSEVCISPSSSLVSTMIHSSSVALYTTHEKLTTTENQEKLQTRTVHTGVLSISAPASSVLVSSSYVSGRYSMLSSFDDKSNTALYTEATLPSIADEVSSTHILKRTSSEIFSPSRIFFSSDSGFLVVMPTTSSSHSGVDKVSTITKLVAPTHLSVSVVLTTAPMVSPALSSVNEGLYTTQMVSPAHSQAIGLTQMVSPTYSNADDVLSTTQMISATYASTTEILTAEIKSPIHFSTTALLSIPQRLSTTRPDVIKRSSTTQVVSPAESVSSSPVIGPVNYPPVVRRNIEPLYVSPCTTLEFKIPWDVFHDLENGNTTSLLLKMATTDRNRLGPDSWIKFNSSTQVLSAIPTGDLYTKRSNYSYVLTAEDSEGLQAETNLTIFIKGPMPKLNYKTRMIVRSSFGDEKSSADMLSVLVQAIENYLGGKDDIFVESFVRGAPLTLVTWGNCSLVGSTCDYATRNYISEKVVNQNEAHPNFRAALLPLFNLEMITEQRSGPCVKTQNHPPELKNPIKMINITSLCQPFRFTIPKFTFVDKEHGDTRHLVLSLLTYDSSPLAKDSWVQFDAASQVVYGFPTYQNIYNQPEQGYKYILKANDSSGKSAQTVLRIKIDAKPILSNYNVTVTVRSFVEKPTPTAGLVLQLVKKISQYLGAENESGIKVLHYNRIEGIQDKLNVTFTNCSRHANSCDFQDVRKSNGRLRSTNGEIAEAFKQAVLPAFVVVDVLQSRSGECIPNHSPTTRRSVLLFNVTLCSSFRFKIPEDVFYDVEDGSASNLSLLLRTYSKKALSRSSWVQFDNLTRELYGIPILNTSSEISFPLNRFYLFASDRNGEETNSTVVIFVQENKFPLRYNVTGILASYLDFKTLHVNIIIELFRKIKDYLKDTDANSVLLISFEVNDTTWPHAVSVTWSNCSINQNVSTVRSRDDPTERLKLTNGMVNPHLIQFLAPQFIVKTIQVEVQTLPSNTPPKSMVSVLNLNVSSCTFLKFLIPKDSFYDQEDSVLKLNLLDIAGRKLSDEYWLQFNQSSNIIYGIPTRAVAKQQPQGGYKFYLVAEDSEGLRANIKVEVNIAGFDNESNYKVMFVFRTLTSRKFFAVDKQLLLIHKLSSFFGQKKVSNVLVESYAEGIGEKPLSLFEWSNCSLPLDRCDLQAISYITRQLKDPHGDINQSLQTALRPEFMIDSITEKTQGHCKGGINTPPKLSKPVDVLNISVCDHFYYKIPSDTFIDLEDGNTRHLELTLMTTDRKPLNKDFWIQLDVVSQQVYALPTITTMNNNTPNEHRLLLVAKDKGGKTGSTVLKFVIVNVPLLVRYQIVVTVESYFDATLPYINQPIALMKKISAYLGNSGGNGIVAVYWNKSTDNLALLSLTYANCSWPSDLCSLQSRRHIIAPFKTKSDQNKPEFSASLLPHFVLRTVHEESYGLCTPAPNTPPRALVSMVTINTSVCGFFEVKVPTGIFYDYEDGGTRNLTLNLLSFDGKKLLTSNWLQFNQNFQVAYGFPYKMDSFPSQYRLIARDKGGLEANATLKFFTNITLLPYNYFVKMSFTSYADPALSDSDVLLRFFSKLIKYIGNTLTFDRMRILSFTVTNSTPRSIHVSWTDCSLRLFPCDYKAIAIIDNQLKIPGGYLNPDFIRSLAPEFIVDSADPMMRGPCTNTRPVVLKPPSAINVSLCSVFRFVIPEDTFYDNEDGYTRNLSISLLDINGHSINMISWVQFNTSSQTMYGVPTSDIAKVEPKTGFEFLILAKDEQDFAVNTTVTLKITGNVPDESYKVTLAYKSFVNTSTYVDELILLINKLSFYLLKGENSTNVRVLSTVKGNGYPPSNLIVLSICSLRYNPCHFEMVQRISYKIKAITELRRGLLPQFSPENVFDQLTGPCRPITNTAPTLANNISSIDMESCALMQYKIPRETFMDKEDGDTNNLTLSLLTKNLQPLPSSSWVQFDASTQMLYALAWRQILVNQPILGYPYVLIATDSGGKFVRDDVRIKLQGSQLAANYQVTVIVASNVEAPQPDVKHLSRLMSKISTYLNVSSSLRLVKYNKTNNNPVNLAVTWTACSLPSNSCDYQQIKELYSKLALPNGNPNHDFTGKLLPEFSLRGVYEEKHGPCAISINTPPTVNGSLTPVNISLCGEFGIKVPFKLFYDDADGDTRNLSLGLIDIDGKILSKNSWVKFDTKRNYIYGMPTLEIFRTQPVEGYKFLLVATDSGGLKQNTTLTIRIVGQNISNHKVDLEVVNHAFQKSETVDILTNLIQKITNYFRGGDSSMLQVHTYSINNKDSSRVFLSWSNCSLDYYPCDFNTLELMRTRLTIQDKLVNPNFMRSLAPEFVVEKIEFTKLGPCLNTKPQIGQDVWTINVSFCRLVNITVPENLFYDKENGNTRSLALSIANVNKSRLPLSSWIQLNRSSQVLYGILSSDVTAEQPIGGYRYYLTAKDEDNLEVTTSFGVSIVNNPPQVDFEVTVVFESYFDASYPYVDEQLLLMKKISTFIGNTDVIDFNVISFIRGKGYPSLNVFKWSNCSFHETSRRRKRAIQSRECNFAHVEWLLNRLKSPDLKAFLLPTFVLKDVIDQRSGSCLKIPNESPRSQRSPINLNISLDQWHLQYRIPNDTFVDKEDGFTRSLLLTLHSNDSKVLSKESWIQFNSAKQQLYGFNTLSVLQNQPKGGYKYKLIAKDSAGKSAELELIINVQNSTHRWNLIFKIVTDSYIPADKPDVDHALKLTSKVLLYLNSSLASNIRPVSFNNTRGFPSTISLTWTLRSFMSDKCDTVDMQHLVSVLESQVGIPKAEFVKALSPEFKVIEASHQPEGLCVVATNKPPMLRKPLNSFRASLCRFLNYTIPEDTFHDVEDGTTRNLTLQLLDHNGKKVGLSSWIQLDSSSQTIFGLPMNRIKGQNMSSQNVYFLVAVDRNGAQTNSSFVVSTFDPVPSVNYLIKLEFLSYTSMTEPEVISLQTFLGKMKQYLQISTRTAESVKVDSYNSSTGFPKAVALTWSSCMIDYNTSCDYQGIMGIWSKLSTGSSLVHPNFMRAVAPEFIVQTVEQIKLGSCLNRPPNVTRVIMLSNIGVCNKVMFNIPKDTFIDQEDGNTDRLSLYLANAQGNPLEKDSWVYLNTSSQVLYAVPSLQQIKAENNKEVIYTLFARDKGSLSEKTELRVSLDKFEPKLNYKASLALNVYYESSISNAYVLHKLRSKLETYLGYPNGSLYFISFTRGTSYPSLSLVSFSFCSLSQSVCDVARVNQLSSKINEAALKTVLLPKFEIKTIFEQRLGPCDIDRNEPPRLLQPLNALIINSSYGMFKYSIPDNTFNDREDGSTENLTLSLLKTDMKGVGLDSWIQLDIKTQTIYALPAAVEYRGQSQDGYTHLLVATDSGKKFAIAQLRVYLRGIRVESPMYQVNITARSFLHAETTTISQIEELTTRLGNFLGNTRCENSKWQIIEYSRSHTYPAVLSAIVSTCTNTCDVAVVETVRSKMFTPKRAVREQLKSAVAPFFVVQHVKLVRCTSSSQLVATFGRIFLAAVPTDFLSEMQDRGHTNTTLRLKGPSFSPWLMLNNVTNILYGVPLFTNFESQNGTSVNYTLFAEDQNGMKTEHIFKVFIIPGDFCDSTPGLVVTLNHSIDWFTGDPSTRVTLMKNIATYLNGNESDLFMRSVQGLERSSRKVVLVGIVNDTMCEKAGASTFINAIVTERMKLSVHDSLWKGHLSIPAPTSSRVIFIQLSCYTSSGENRTNSLLKDIITTGMMTPLGAVNPTVLDALSRFGVLDVFSRLPTAVIPRPRLTGAKIVSPPATSGWMVVLFGLSVFALLVIIGVWLCCYYKQNLKQRGGVLITATTSPAKGRKYNVLEDDQEFLVYSEEEERKVRKAEETNVESTLKTKRQESESLEFYNGITKLKNEREFEVKEATEPTVEAEKQVQGDVTSKRDSFENSRLLFEDNFVQAEEEEGERDDKESYSPPPLYQVEAPLYFLPPLLGSGSQPGSGAVNASYENDTSPPTSPRRTSPVDNGPFKVLPRRKSSAEYHHIEPPVSPSQQGSTAREKGPSPREGKVNVSKPKITRQAPIDDNANLESSLSDDGRMYQSESDYDEIDNLSLLSSTIPQGPLRRSQRRQLPELPAVPPLHRLSLSRGSTNGSPPGSSNTAVSSLNSPYEGGERPMVTRPTDSEVPGLRPPEYNTRLAEPLVFHVPLDLGPRSNGTTATINLGGAPMQVPLVLSRDRFDTPGLRVGLQPPLIYRDYPSRLTELDPRQSSIGYRNEAEDISHHLTEDLDLGSLDNRGQAPYLNSNRAVNNEQQRERTRNEYPGSREQTRDRAQRPDLDLGNGWTSRV